MRFSRDSVIGMALNVQIANAESRKPLENKAFHTLEAMGLPAIQTGSAADRRSRTATVTNEWAENAPQPNRTIGPSTRLDAPET